MGETLKNGQGFTPGGRRLAGEQGKTAGALHLHKGDRMAFTPYSQMKIAMKVAIQNKEPTIIGDWIYDPEPLKEALDTIEKLEDALLKALPYVTDAIDCPAFKQGFVKAEVDAIVKTIELIR